MKKAKTYKGIPIVDDPEILRRIPKGQLGLFKTKVENPKNKKKKPKHKKREFQKLVDGD